MISDVALEQIVKNHNVYKMCQHDADYEVTYEYLRESVFQWCRECWDREVTSPNTDVKIKPAQMNVVSVKCIHCEHALDWCACIA